MGAQVAAHIYFDGHEFELPDVDEVLAGGPIVQLKKLESGRVAWTVVRDPVDRGSERREARLRLTSGDEEAASAIAYARRLRPPMKSFAFEMRLKLGRASLSRQAIYQWESGEVRVPASVLLAAARICDISVEELIRRSVRANLSGAT
jgi:transcriptional regulator with XRE-family HTH domain